MKPSPEKLTYHHGNLRAALLSAAWEVIKAHGLEGLTLRAVAERLGVSRSAIYRHYRSKDELLGQIILEGFEQLRSTTSEAASSRAQCVESCPLDQLHHMGLAYIRFAVEQAALYDLMFHPSLIGRTGENVKEASVRSYEVLTGMLQRCQNAGQIKCGDPQRQAFAIWASLHGLVSLCRGGPPHVLPNATVEGGFEMLLEQLMAGLATRDQWRDALRSNQL